MFRDTSSDSGQGGVKAKYDAISEVYNTSFGNRSGRGPDRRFRLMMQLVPRHLYRTSMPVLEIGCGTGLYSKYLKDNFKECYCGSDLSPGMLEVAKASGISNVVVADAARLPFADGSVCVVFGFGVLHHVTDTPCVFREARRVLQDGGVFLIMEPNHLNPCNIALAFWKNLERGMLRSCGRRWQAEAQDSGLHLIASQKAAFLPSRPLVLSRVFDLAESFMEHIPLLKRLAIFDMMAFQKNGA